jgi:hypothetical protein
VEFTSGGVSYDPPIGRAKPGSRPDRLEPGQARWRRFPNAHGGGAAVHPSETPRYLKHGIRFEDGRLGLVYLIEREAYVDVVHFKFVTREG